MINYLILIDSRIDNKETIIYSLLKTTFYIIVEYEIDTLDSIKDKINLLDIKSLEGVAIFQENYNIPTYNFVQSFNKSILNNVAELDSDLLTWTDFTSLLSYFKNTLNVLKIDLLGCNIYNNHNWIYVINKISMDLGISIQSSNDNTGSENLGGNWILESNNSNMIGIYFTEEIKKYKFVLGSSSNHTGFILSNGKVQTCGSNSSGQLGNNSGLNSSVPVYMQNPENTGDLTGAVAISFGNSHTAVLLYNGKVISCGSNTQDQLGNNSTTSSKIPVYMKNPENTGDLTGAVAISCGYSHTAVLLNNGKVISCGLNSSGQLGNNSATNSTIPVYMKDPDNTKVLTGAIAISCGNYTTTVLVGGGKVISCGKNSSGQFGNNLTTNSSVPVYMRNTGDSADLTGAVAISCGEAHVAVLVGEGKVISCGKNSSGQFGNNLTTNSSVPVYMKNPENTADLTGVTKISCGDSHTTVLISGNKVISCGNNGEGQLGDNTTSLRSIPVYMRDPDNSSNDLTGAIDISCGFYHTTVLVSGGKVISCGRNIYGELGNNSVLYSLIPIYMRNTGDSGDLTGAIAISCGNSHTAVLLNDTKVISCGLNKTKGQLGDNTLTDRSLPVYMKNPENTGDLTGATAINCGNSHTAVLLNDGKVILCGDNSSGQLGNNSTTDSSLPVYMRNTGDSADLTGASAISCGNSHTAVLLTNGKVISCGKNSSGQLGNNSETLSSVPVYMQNPENTGDLTGAVSTRCGNSHTVVLLNNGKVISCGNNSSGQLGNNSTTKTKIPVYVKDPANPTNDLTGAIAINCGSAHTVVLLNNGKVISCGSNSSGQLGNNSTTSSSVPVYMKDPPNLNYDLTGAIAISCGLYHTTVLIGGGKVISCGNNSLGQLGNNSTTDSSVPVYMKDPDNPTNDLTVATAIATSGGSSHNAVLVSGGKVISCGSNGQGQLGINSIFRHSIPVYMINNNNLKIYSISNFNKCYYDYKVNNKNISQLKSIGYNASDLRISGFNLTDLKVVLTDYELIQADYTILELISDIVSNLNRINAALKVSRQKTKK
jgi:alpha-tubulin suppressor-like RCC1 family protein